MAGCRPLKSAKNGWDFRKRPPSAATLVGTFGFVVEFYVWGLGQYTPRPVEGRVLTPGQHTDANGHADLTCMRLYCTRA